MEISAVDDAYKRIERWIEMTKERDELTENALQTAFLLNVFRDALKWIRFTAMPEMRELGEPKISQLTKGKPRSAYPGIIAAAIEKATGQSPSKDNLKPLVTLCNGLGLFSRCTIQSYENHTISLPRKKISNNKS